MPEPNEAAGSVGWAGGRCAEWGVSRNQLASKWLLLVLEGWTGSQTMNRR